MWEESNEYRLPAETALIAILSCHPSLASWPDYYPEHLSGRQFFERKTLEAILSRFANITPGPLQHCTNALFTTMPTGSGDFCSGKQLRSANWNYLRPVY
jgi:hypothetical protein